MTTDEIFNYVMDDPEDTNPNVLKSLLNSIPTSGSGVLIVTVTDQKVPTGGQTAIVQVCDKTAAEIFEAAKKNPVWFYYYRANEDQEVTVQDHVWMYLESAVLLNTSNYIFYSSKFDNKSFEFKASNGSDFPATIPVV